MPEIIIYTTPICPYCAQAKKLLDKKGVSYKEIDISQDAQLREEMMTKSGGRRTVPQIFINNQHIGGCDDLYNLEQKGNLDSLLKS